MWMSERVVEMRRRRAEAAAVRRAELIRLLALGRTQAEIAAEWGLTRQRVHALVKEAEERGELKFVEALDASA